MSSEGSRYVIGVDLGTTNSAVAYYDLGGDYSTKVISFRVPQMTGHCHFATLPSLPSFCYLLSEEEKGASSMMKMPWEVDSTGYVVGEYAKIQGALVPARLVHSAKSWLCNSAAARNEKILPPFGDPSSRISPIEATRRYLTHLASAWNHTVAKGKPDLEFEQQDIILTVPASFDEVARGLTLEAAKKAGWEKITLLEEPQAAFYHWISRHGEKWEQLLPIDSKILVCDVGGGTTDFSLIEVVEKDGKPTFVRQAVGEHLLLGGDNIDAFIAHEIDKAKSQNDGNSFDGMLWQQLQHRARSAKEAILEALESGKEDFSFNIQLLGRGSSLVGSSRSVTLEGKKIQGKVLDAFFGQQQIETALNVRSKTALKTMGLAYEEEPSITKHLARFLARGSKTLKNTTAPNFVLFNGGTMKAKPFQNAILDAIENWFGTRPEQIETSSFDLAVARGAAYYGRARRGEGVTIRGGSSRGFYLEIDQQNMDGKLVRKALTLLPKGSEEGATYEANHTFMLKPNTPVSFTLMTSQVRLEDQSGDLIPLSPEEMRSLPSLKTILKYGKGKENKQIPVKLGVSLTPVGTLDMWLHALDTDHKYALQFQVRGGEGQEDSTKNSHQETVDVSCDPKDLAIAREHIASLFTGRALFTPNKLMENLEKSLDRPRKKWSPSLLRALCDAVLSQSKQRLASSTLQQRFWNLTGFTLRPGFGYPLDDHRIKELWKIVLEEGRKPISEEIEQQLWIALRRLAGGLNRGQQMQLASQIQSELTQTRKTLRGAQQALFIEKVRAFGAFELIDVKLKKKVGESVLQRILAGKELPCDPWVLGRLGARHLFHATYAHLLPRDVATDWLKKLIKHLKSISSEEKKSRLKLLAFPIIQIACKSDEKSADLGETLREDIDKIYASSSSHSKVMLQIKGQNLAESDVQEEIYGDSLPPGLVLLEEAAING